MQLDPEIIALGVTIIPAVVWLVRLEGRVNAADKVVQAVQADLVAVKVMAPGIEAKFRSDIATVKRFCKLAMPQHVSALDEIEKQFFSEFGPRRARPRRDAEPSNVRAPTADAPRARRARARAVQTMSSRRRTWR